jgi:hypothetical protein
VWQIVAVADEGRLNIMSLHRSLVKKKKKKKKNQA